MKQMFKEESGKWSSKRIWGTILLGSATIMVIAGGFGMYNPEPSMVNTMFYTGAGVLGIGVFKK